MKQANLDQIDNLMQRALTARQTKSWPALREAAEGLVNMARAAELNGGHNADHPRLLALNVSAELREIVARLIPKNKLDRCGGFRWHFEAGRYVVSIYGAGFSAPVHAYASDTELKEHCPSAKELCRTK